MKVLGFNLHKISIEKFKERIEKLDIKTNIDIKDIKKLEPTFKTKDEVIQAKFIYNVKYDPGFVNIDLEGSVILSLEEKQAKEVARLWKDKDMPEDFRVFLFNTIIKKASVKALGLEDDLNLPLHLPLPLMRKKEK